MGENLRRKSGGIHEHQGQAQAKGAGSKDKRSRQEASDKAER